MSTTSSIYVWSDVDPVSSNWHSGGAALIVAESVERARVLWAEAGHDAGAIDGDPDDVWALRNPESEAIRIYENAGCC